MIETDLVFLQDTYIFENIRDGILIIDMQGNIIYKNAGAADHLGLHSESAKPLVLSELFQKDNGVNDGFYQYLFDSIYDKNTVHTGTIPYILPNKQKKILQVRTSFWENPNDKQQRGVLLIFQDITEQEQLKQHRKEAMLLFNILLVLVCGWVVFVNGLSAIGIQIAPFQMTYILLTFGMIVSFVVYKKTNMTLNDLGLSKKHLKESIIMNVIVSSIIILAFILVKIILIRFYPDFFPEGQPFWFFRITSLGMLLYPVTVFLQEFIARGVLQESLIAIFTGNHKELKATLLAALLFAALHVHRSFAYIAGSFFLVVLMSPLYLKYRNIWGVCISHYVLCMTAIFLGFM